MEIKIIIILFFIIIVGITIRKYFIERFNNAELEPGEISISEHSEIDEPIFTGDGQTTIS